MIKRTLVFSNPAYLSTKNRQLVVCYPDGEKEAQTVPIEDIGILVLEHSQITLTNGLLTRLVRNKAAVITCDEQHLPVSLLQPLTGHTEQAERYRYQLGASAPLKKNLWRQTVIAKITNQALHLDERGKPAKKLFRWADRVKTADGENHESLAAAYYWQNIYDIGDFNRHRYGMPPNSLLNYGYAVLRALTARALISTGLLPGIGIFHRNKYSAYCLADDVMEPYRIYVDALVGDLIHEMENVGVLSPPIKLKLLQIPTLDVKLDGKTGPLMNALSRTTNSLYECFSGVRRKILYPEYE